MAIISTDPVLVHNPYSWALYCSFCGGPMFEVGGSYEPDKPTWLRDLVAMKENTASGSVDVFPVMLCGNGLGEDAWISCTNERFTLAPCHLACLNMCYLFLDWIAGAEMTFDYGVPPRSMADVLNVIKARAFETLHCDPMGNTIVLFEPSRYCGMDFLQEHDEWVPKDPSERKVNVWLADPTILEEPGDRKEMPLGKWLAAKVPTEILYEIFIYTYDLEEALPSACDYIFPQSWWLEAIRSVVWMKGLILSTKEPFYNWERLARDISRIDESYFPGIDGLRNRKRIWQLISNMREADMFGLQTQNYKDLSPYMLWLDDNKDWCWKSWTELLTWNDYS